jgi:hypothetical protein
VAEFFSQYCKSSAAWVQHDYGKPGLPADVPGVLSTPTLVNLWHKPVGNSAGAAGAAGDSCEFVAELTFSASARCSLSVLIGITLQCYWITCL